MIDKASPAGWVVQVTVLAPPSAADTRWIGPRLSAAPSFKYFNVAIAAPNKALEATTKHLVATKAEDGALSCVRGLSAGELAVLKLAAGEVGPA
jgi:hypothetical protein